MESLPIGLLHLIDSYLEMFDHLAFTEVCKKTNRLKLDYSSDWKNCAKRFYRFDLRFLKYLMQYKKFNDMKLLRTGNIECAKWFISSGVNSNWNDGFFEACLSGNIEIVHLLIQKGAYIWDLGLFGACSNGHIEIAHLLIEKGANDWNFGLRGACKGGHTEIAKLMIQKGATSCDWCGGKKHQF